jgi:hypothetical protein
MPEQYTPETAPALLMSALAVACDTCGAEPGNLCTSHGGTRVRRHDVHRTRSLARQHADAQAAAVAPEPPAGTPLTAEELAEVEARAAAPEQPCSDPRHTGPIREQYGCNGPDPAAEQPADTRAPFAFVEITPTGADPDEIAVNAGSHHMSPAAVAYGLRGVADEFDRRARAQGDEPIPHPAVPRTEREHWQAIADALNAAESAGMGVGVDLDGTLTDHRMWSVVWDREAERWDVAGYDDDTEPTPAIPDHVVNEEQAAEESLADAARRYARRLAAVERLCSGRPGYHTITVKALLTAMSDADEQADEPDCPGCKAIAEGTE